MNTEHTNQPRQAANAAFEQWWQCHGLEDPMDDEDRYYITASSWARRGYLAAMQAQPTAMMALAEEVRETCWQVGSGDATIRELDLAAIVDRHAAQPPAQQQAEPVAPAVKKSLTAEPQAELATLCASCARADVNCPIYPQQTASCVEHRPAAQQQAEPVGEVYGEERAYSDYIPLVEWHVSTRELPKGTKLYTKPPAVAEPAVLAALEPFALISSEGVVTQTKGHVTVTTCAEYFHRAAAMLAATPQGAAAGWIDPNDKTQKQYLPHIGEPVLFCHDGVTYYGQHTGGSFKAGQGVTARLFGTWDCFWMYPPVAAQKGGEA